MKPKQNKSQKPDSVPDFAPGSLGWNGALKFFSSGTKFKIDANHWRIVAFVLLAVAISQSITINSLFPLKTIETIAVTKEAGGRLTVDATPVGKWVPDNESIGYFLNLWTRNVFEINRPVIEDALKFSSDFAIDNAVSQLRALRSKENPIVLLRDNPNFNRQYEFVTLNFIKSDVVLIRFKTITRKRDEISIKEYAMTITFTLIKPNTTAKAMVNAAGVYITNFNITEEVATK